MNKRESPKQNLISRLSSTKTITLPDIHRRNHHSLESSKLRGEEKPFKQESPMDCSNRCLSTIRKVFEKIATDLNKRTLELMQNDDWQIESWNYVSQTPRPSPTHFRHFSESSVPSVYPRLPESYMLEGTPKHAFHLSTRTTPTVDKKLKKKKSPRLPTVGPFKLKKKVKMLKIADLSAPQLSELRTAVYFEWLRTLQRSFGIKPHEETSSFKYHIGKGNNHPLVKSIMAKRWWWSSVDTPKAANFVWTQNRHKPTLKAIKASSPFTEQTQGFDKPRYRVPYYLITEQLKKNGFFLIKKTDSYQVSHELSAFRPTDFKLHNRLPKNIHLCEKKNLLKNLVHFYTLKSQDVFSHIPLTFHVRKEEDLQAVEDCHKLGDCWILKPGEKSNRGNGIHITDNISEMKNILRETSHTLVVQKYIDKPLLVHKRKFDIRCFGLIACLGKRVQGYFYKEGYIRTSSKEFSMKKISDKFVHLTNDAIQCRSEDYGKYEAGNKMSYSEFNKYLLKNHSGVDFYGDILPQIRQKVADSVEAVQYLVSPKHSDSTFEILGYDFMIDQQFNVWLIEVNTNPCLELSSSYLATLIPSVIDNAFRIALDPLFPPSPEHKKFQNWVQEVNLNNHYELVFSGPRNNSN